MKAKNKERVLELIREGKTYKETLETLKKESDDTIAGGSFYRLKQELNPTQKIDEALEKSAGRREEREDKKKTQARRAKWSPQKQRQADESKLADLINTGLYHGVMPLCKSKQLKIEDVKEINMGGAVVGSVLYFFPDVNLDHPLIVLATRGVLFYIRFKAICSKVAEIVEGVKEKLTIGGSGIKPGWEAH